MSKKEKKKKNEIAGRIKVARQQAQMGPAQLRQELKARGIDLSKTGLHRLETTDPKNPNLKQIAAIAEITNVSAGWILFGEGPSVQAKDVGAAIRGRVIDTIELMSGALDMKKRQRTTLENWLESMRSTSSGKVKKP